MSAQMLLENFEFIANAPGGVLKLREAILQLGVQGKLVEQNVHDEPSNILIKRIRDSQILSESRSKGSFRKQYIEPVGANDRLFAIPESWVWTRLGEIGEWGSGSTPPRGNNEYYGGGITWLKSGELQDNQALIGSQETVSKLALEEGSFRRNQMGDVLIAMYGATIGKVAILAEPAVTNQAVCGCTPAEGVSNRYLFNFLVSQRANFRNASEGGAQPNISKVKIVRYPFPLPPLEEQKRIVAKVDELMALCDKLEAQQQERERRFPMLSRACHARFLESPSLANLKTIFDGAESISIEDLRKTVITLAVQGKLISQNLDNDSVDELLDKISNQNTLQKAIPKSRKLKVPETEPFNIPKSWRWIQLGQIANLIEYGTSYKADSNSKNIPIYRMGNVQNGNISDSNRRC